MDSENEIKKSPLIAISILVIIVIGLWQLNRQPVSDNPTVELEQPTTSQPSPLTPMNETSEIVGDDITTNQQQTEQQTAQQYSSNRLAQQPKATANALLPTVNAGGDFSIDEFERTYLEGQGAAHDGSEVTFKWLTSEEFFLQTKGIDYSRSDSQYLDVRIFHPNRARTKFIAPETSDIRYLEIYLVVTDQYGQWAADKITITVHGVEPENVAFYDVDMPDQNLRACTEEYANSHLITFVSEITELHCNNRNISDLTGIEYFSNLKTLGLVNNKLKDISPLASLVQLTSLNLGKNRIYDLRPLSALTYLSQLNLHDNDISDVTPLTQLNLLVDLNLSQNVIEKLQYFGDKFYINKLNLSSNPITNLAALTQIHGLKELNISNTRTRHIRPLFSRRAVNRIEVLDLSHNNLPCGLLDSLSNIRTIKVIRKGECRQ